jgi:hypothetical protein
MPDLSSIVNQLRAQRRNVQRELDRLDSAIRALQGLTTTNGATRTRLVASKSHRTLSVTARRKIAAAQRARWAAWKAKQKRAA